MIFPNQIKCAKQVVEKLSAFNIVDVTAPCQSGKTGVKEAICSLLGPETNIIITCSIPDRILNDQHVENFSSLHHKNHRFAFLSALTGAFSKRWFKEYGAIADVLIVDENHFGAGSVSRMTRLIEKLRNDNPNVKLVFIGATGYQISHKFGKSVQVRMEVPESYFGVREMLNLNLIEEIVPQFEYLSSCETEYEFNDAFFNAYHHVMNRDGLSIVRCEGKKSATANKLAREITRRNGVKTVVATQFEENGIRDNIRHACELSEHSAVCLIINDSMRAGVNIGEAKCRVNLVVENHRVVSNAVQGLIGRVCGYHTNSSMTIAAPREIVEFQDRFVSGDDISMDLVNEVLGTTTYRAIATGLNVASKKTHGVRARGEDQENPHFATAYKFNINRLYEIKVDGLNEFGLRKLIDGIEQLRDKPTSRVKTDLMAYFTTYERHRTDNTRKAFQAANSKLDEAIANGQDVIFERFANNVNGKVGGSTKLAVRIDASDVYIVVRGRQMTAEDIEDRTYSLRNVTFFNSMEI